MSEPGLLCHECSVHRCGECGELCMCLEVSTNGGDECEHCPTPCPVGEQGAPDADG